MRRRTMKKTALVIMAAGPVLANGAPDDTAAEECRALGGALA